MDNGTSTEQDSESLGEGAGFDPRQRSTIGFPYADLSDVEGVAFAIHNNVATGGCDDAQLAPWLNLSAKSSGFRVRLSAARLFGLIETREAGMHYLTDLGKMMVDPMRQRAARVQAFLSVPLYSRIFEDYKGGVLPPPAALELAIERSGVAPKQKSRARQIFERAAEQAGFFEQGKNRLVKPGIAEAAAPLRADSSKGSDKPGGDDGGRSAGSGGEGGGGSGLRTGLDPLIVGLVNKLPDANLPWPQADRVTWLKALNMIIPLVYGEAGDIKISTLGGAEPGKAGQPGSAQSE